MFETEIQQPRKFQRRVKGQNGDPYCLLTMIIFQTYQVSTIT